MNAATVTATIAMDDAGYILGSYAITFVVVGLLAWRVIQRGRRLADQIDDDDKYWI